MRNAQDDLISQLRAGKSMLTTGEVMALLRKNRHTVCRWCRTGKIPHIRLPDNSYAFYPVSLADWLIARRIA